MSSIRTDVMQHETDFVYQGSTHPVSVSLKNSHVIPDDDLRGMANIIHESKRLAALLKAPINPDREAQDKVDAALELQITRLGLAIGEEVESRLHYNATVVQFYKKSLTANRFLQWQEGLRQKFAQAYREVIAEIRSVGGAIVQHPYSDPEVGEILSHTVSLDYPSDWIQASNAAGPMAVVSGPENSTPHYAHRKHWARNTIAKNSLGRDSAYITENSLEETLRSIRVHDPSVKVESVPFEIGEHILYGFTFNSREFFNPEVHDADENGKPVGDDWILDDFTYGGEPESDEGTYFRFNYREGETIPTLMLPVNDVLAYPTAYHEFMHRLEETLNNGVLKRQQIAFLARRTADDKGNRRPVSNIHSDGYSPAGETPEDFQWSIPKGREGDFVIPYISREYLTSGNREVLAVGAEMLFAEALGGFLGLDEEYEKIDRDHRGFVLGIFAAA